MPPSLDHISLAAGDWVAVILFLTLVIGMALWVKFQQQGSEDFFLAGRSMNWIVVAISTYATLFSTISFVATPGEAYQNGLMLSLWMLGAFMFPLAVWIFLRFFFMAKSFTAYEYLESRFNLPTRLAGGLIYVVIRLLYAGTVMYAAAQVFEALIGWDPMSTILIVGIFTIFYTATGGMKAVMFTDVVQGVVVIVGITVICAKVLSVADYDIAAIYNHAAANGKGYGQVLEPTFWRLDLHDRFSFWLLVIYLLTAPIQAVTADQSTVQRLLTSKGYAGAKRAVIVQAFANIPIGGMLWLIGVGLFYFYSAGGGALPADVSSDQVFGYFINTQLPTPLPGLIVAALLAALMSTIDSTVNCIANVVHRDGLIRLNIMKDGSTHEMSVCRSITVAAGVLGVGFAVMMTLGGEGIKSSVMEISGIWGSLWGVLMMPFVLGVLVPYVSGKAMFTGMAIGGLTNLILPYLLYYRVPADERVSFLWVGVPGMLIAGVLPLMLSLAWPNHKQLRNLTHWSLESRHVNDTHDEQETDIQQAPETIDSEQDTPSPVAS